MITVFKFEPEKQRLYRLKIWLCKKLWTLAYNLHPYPPEFHRQISQQYEDNKLAAYITLDQFEQYARKITGIE